MNKPLIACIIVFNLFPMTRVVADDENPSSELQNDAGQSVIRLATETQKLSGIETITLKPASHHTEFTAYGKAINIQPLLALRNRYLLALTERSSAKARFKQAEQNIISGMNVTAWIPDAKEQMTGVIIPKSALIWYMDQALVYLKTAEEAFSRRTIDHYSASADGYFIPDAIKPGEQIVTKGAQMLLSEELRGQIPSEDED